MDETPRQPNDPRPDPLAIRPDMGGAGGFARWEAGIKRDAADVARWSDEGGAPITDGRRGPFTYSIKEYLETCEAEDRAYTIAMLNDYRRRFIAAGGVGRRFDSLQLLAAARTSANRILRTLMRSRGVEDRPATECEIRETMAGLAAEADTALSKGRLRAFGRLLWPFGPPMR